MSKKRKTVSWIDSKNENNNYNDYCENCHRRDSDIAGKKVENIEIIRRSSEKFHWKKKLCNIKREHREFLLCNECFQLLESNNNKWITSWPAYLWHIFSDPLNRNKLYEIWKYIPVSMRHSWIISYQQLCLGGMNVSMTEPQPYFEDVTKEVEIVDKLKKSGKLVDLINVCNNYLCYCSIKCPWGCTEFIDNCGIIPYDEFLAIVLHANQPFKHSGRKNILLGMSKNYLGFSECFFNHNKWPIRCALKFVMDHGYCVATCFDHNGGCEERYIHPPENPLNNFLPAHRSDQLAHVVLNPRTIKSMRIGKINDIYEISNCRGGFRGADTCDIVDVGDFSYTSHLEGRNRGLMLYGRIDIKKKLQQLVATRNIPSWFEREELRNEQMYEFENCTAVEKALQGATYVPLLDAIEMGQQVSNNLLFSNWSCIMPLCFSSNDKFGPMPLHIPPTHHKKDYRLLWFLMSLGMYVPVFWKCMYQYSTMKSTNNNTDWIDELLKLITITSVSGVRKAKRIGTMTVDSIHCLEDSIMKKIAPVDDQHEIASFKWDQLARCLFTIKYVHVMFENIISSNDLQIPELSSNIDIIIIINGNENRKKGTTKPLVSMKVNGEEFILIFIGSSKTTGEEIDEQKNIYWTSTVIMRYMQKYQNCSWWEIKRNQTSRKIESSLFDAIIGTIDYGILVYERKEKIREKNLQQSYFECIGGQTLSKCPKHGVFLVVCSLKNNKKKCVVKEKKKMKDCSGTVGYCCPIIHCKICCCRKHVNNELFISENYSGGNNIIDNTNIVQQHTDNIEPYEMESEMNSETNSDMSNTEEIGNEDFLTTIESDFADCIFEYHDKERSEDSSTRSNEDTTRSSNNDLEYFFPTTVASDTKGLTIKASTPSKMPLHILLNEHGSLLIRRSKRIQKTRKTQGFLETIISTTKGKSIPLVYPEGMLFPSIFWHAQSDGSIDGALPVALLDSKEVSKSFGYASIEDHMRSRLKNSSSLCSTDPRYIFFAFDCINNLRTRGFDNRIILQRGFEHMLGPGKIHGFCNADSTLTSDLIDSRRNVYKLAAIIRWKEPTYFYTHTCNQATHFGIAPLHNYLKELISQTELDPTLSMEIKKEYITAFHQAMTMQMTRTWLKIARLYMTYICTSHEHPLGVILRYWWRFEYQDAEGNLPHIHAVLCTNENKHNENDLEIILNRVRCSSTTFMMPSEMEQFASEGLLPDVSFITTQEIHHNMNTILPHNCEAAHFRCCRQVGPNKEDLQCRRIDYNENNLHHGSYGYRKFDAHHTPEAIEIFRKLNLLDENNAWTDSKLEAGKYFYPTNAGEYFSPCNPRLFISHGSSDNLQVCDQYFCSRYLSKYIQSVDSNQKVEIKSMRTSPDLKVDRPFIPNTKISSGHYYEEQRLKQMGSKICFVGRALPLTEAIALLFQEPQVFTNQTFIDIPTVPLEQRPSFERHTRSTWMTMEELIQQKQSPCPPMGTSISRAIQLRQQIKLPIERQHTTIEMMLINDALQSPVSIDAITIFGCRPPELRFIPNPILYFQCFTRKIINLQNKVRYLTEMLRFDVKQSGWIDGLDAQIVVKQIAIPTILSLPECKGTIRDVFLYLSNQVIENSTNQQNTSTSNEKYIASNHLLDLSYTVEFLPLPIYNVVQPSQMNRFLIHLLLSMGSFSNEIELYTGGNMTQCFKNANLLPRHRNPTNEDINKLVKTFILTQLLFIPSGTRDFDAKCVDAYKTCHSILLDNCSISPEIPPYLYTTLYLQATTTAINFYYQMKQNLARTLATLNNVPSEDELMATSRQSPLCWNPVIQQLEDQSNDSFQECQIICRNTKGAIDLYCTANSHSTPKSIIITGGPGTGKTYQLQLATTYALSKGLNTTITALMSERSNILGGMHIHSLFCIPVRNYPNIHRMVDLTILALNKSPERLQFLRTLDVLCIDEMGYLSGKIMNIMDTVMRFIRGSHSFMGGVLVLGTLDPLQLGPISDYPLLLSSLVLTSFRIIFMNYSIRGRHDTAMRQLIQISRQMNPSKDDLKEFQHIILTQCRHVDSFDDPIITRDVLHLFGTRAAVKLAEENYYSRVEQQGFIIINHPADTLQTFIKSHSSWKSALPKTIHQMNHIVNERELLRLHEGLIVEVTFNKPNHWSHGQMGMVLELPTTHQLLHWEPINLMLAPVGVTILPPTLNNVHTKKELLAAHWKEIKIGTAPEIEHRLPNGIIAKRKQYGICPRHAMTIHKAMGNEFGTIITAIGCQNNTNMFRLWQREQVQVILSRTKRCSDIIFVGNKMETAQYLTELLLHPSPYTSYMMHYLNQIEHANYSPPSIQPHAFLPFTIKNIEPQLEDFGSVYLLLSLATKFDTYIGQTGKQLQRRVQEHNSGNGAKDTQDISLRPWFPIAFVTGFDDNSSFERRRFEREWQRLRYSIGQGVLTPLRIIQLGEQLIGQWYATYSTTSSQLKMIRCVEFHGE